MGVPMARNLLRAGADLTVYSRSRDPVDLLVGEGASSALSPKELALAVRGGALIVMVTDTAAVEAVIEGPEGILSSGVEGLDGTLVIDMGTTQVAPTRRMAEAVSGLGGAYVDAPVSGGVVGAEEANLTILAGGAVKDFEKALPLFEVMGRRITHLGGVGSGQVTKTANQMIVGLTLGAVAEALTLAERAGVDPANVREALIGGFADSRILDLHGLRMVEDRFEPGGRVSVQLKDVRQAMELARELGLKLPGLSRNLELWEAAVVRGWGDLDHSAIVKLIRDPD